MTKRQAKIGCWILSALAVFSGHAGAAATDIPGTNIPDKVRYPFQGEDMRSYGVELNADMPRLNRLLGPLQRAAALETTDTVLKPHPGLALPSEDKSLLREVLEKEHLTGEFAQLLSAFRTETERVDSPLMRNGVYNPFRLQEVNYVMYNPLALPVVARQITDRLHAAYGGTHHDLGALMRVAMDELDMVVPAEHRQPPADFSGYVARLVKTIAYAQQERAAVLSVLDAEEKKLLFSTAPLLLLGDTDSSKHEPTEQEKATDEARWLRFFHIVLKLDLPRLLNASVAVARAIDLETLKALARNPGKLAHYPKDWIMHKQNNLTVLDTPAGRVLIGGTQDNFYSEDAALIIDLGGNDKYFNHAGGSSQDYPFSVVIDLSGDDVYSATEDFAQGAGLFGGGFLIDLQGDDRYTAKNFAQGTGIFGVGLLADLAGSDQYSAMTAAQGAGNFGIGILAEGGGDDSYYGNFFAQGAGYVGGFGAVVEASGNDSYFAGGLFEDFRAPGQSYVSMSQGYGYGMRLSPAVDTSGGIGVLAEAEGNDTYVADYFAQGSSYWFALGILDDRKGHDRYIAGRYSQGAGVHMSAGVLIDGAGDDDYLADFGVSQGCGHDFGIGFLLDNGGNDHYVAGDLAQGAGNNSGIGILSDNGGNDVYSLKSNGQGHGNFDAARNSSSFGFLFDTSGNDSYSHGGGNGSLIYQPSWGILLDTE